MKLKITPSILSSKLKGKINSIQEKIDQEILEEKKIVTTKKIKSSKFKLQVLSRLITLQIKSYILGLLWSALLFVMSFLLSFFLLFFILFTIYYFYLLSLQQEQVIYNQTNNWTSNVQTYYSSDFFKSYFKPFPDSQSFVSESVIPHWIPVSWTVIQWYCENNMWYKNKAPVYRQMWCEQYGSESYRKISKWNSPWMTWVHWWMDFIADEWTEIFSMNKWIVINIWTNPDSWGWWYFVDVVWETYDWRPLVSRYWHMSKQAVKKWDVVQAWDLLGFIWNTGLSSQAHLHLWICEWMTNFDTCYLSKPWKTTLDSFQYKVVNPFKYLLNYEYYWRWDEFLSDWAEFKYQVWKSWISIWFPIENTLEWFYKSTNEKVTSNDLDYLYVKVWLQEWVAPIILKTLHYRENSFWIKNPSLKQNKAWYSNTNEWLFWLDRDVAKTLNRVECNKSDQYFWVPNEVVTVKQFETQLRCAALYFKYKSKLADSKNWLSFIHPENFKIESDKDIEEFRSIVSKWNLWDSYYWNNYKDLPEYKSMPEISEWKIISYEKRDGFLTYLLKNQSNLDSIILDADTFISENKRSIVKDTIVKTVNSLDQEIERKKEQIINIINAWIWIYNKLFEGEWNPNEDSIKTE